METVNFHPLIVVASPREAGVIVDSFGLEKESSFSFNSYDSECGVYNRVTPFPITLAVTGVLEHSMVSATSLLLSKNHTFSHVINFGCVGSYSTKQAQLGNAYLVQCCHKYGIGDNTHWAKPIILSSPSKKLKEDLLVECATGSRYSTEEDRKSKYFPSSAHVEDMELYGVAHLCTTLAIPIYSVKYVVNLVQGTHESVREELRSNIVPFRQAGLSLLKMLFDLLREYDTSIITSSV